MIRIRKKIKYGTLSILALSLTMIYGFNCSQSFVVEDIGASGGDTTKMVAVKPDFGVSLLTAENIWKTMISVTGVETATDMSNPLDVQITTMFQERVGALPVSRDLDAITGPMMVAVTNLAATVCEKAVVLEIQKQPGERRFFGNVDFSQPINSVSSAILSDVTARMSRAFWSREISDAERGMIEAQMLFAFPADLTAANRAATESLGGKTVYTETKNLGIGVCTAMLSSLDALLY